MESAQLLSGWEWEWMGMAVFSSDLPEKGEAAAQKLCSARNHSVSQTLYSFSPSIKSQSFIMWAQGCGEAVNGLQTEWTAP